MAPPWAAGGGDGLHIQKVTANILMNVSMRADRGWSSSLEVGRIAKSSLQSLPYETVRSASDFRLKNEMDRACGTYGVEDGCVQGFWWGNLQERGRLEY